MPDSTQKEFKKLGKSLQDSLSKLEDLYFLPKDFKGIRRSTGKLGSSFWGVRSYLRVKDGALNESGKIKLEALQKQTTEVLEQINTFFESDFADYQKKVEALDFSLFDELEPIKLEED